MPKVLVTAGTGFIAGHCIAQLLEKGYEVVTTVRTPEKGQKLSDAFPNSKNKLSYQIVADVAQKGAFDEVVKTTPNLDYVLHTASPFHYNIQDPVKDFLEPALIGTTSILQAINDYAPSVKRVVLTSSFAAIRSGRPGNEPVYDETCWNPITWDEAAQDHSKTYQGSKASVNPSYMGVYITKRALAERAAWDFVEKEKPKFEFATINPSLVFGPAAPHLSKGELSGLNTSNIRILDMIQGKMKNELKMTGLYSFVDVRDTALAHVRAMELPEAAGKRFFIVAGTYTNKEIAKIIASISPELKDKLPEDIDGQQDDFPPPDKRYGLNNTRSIEVLGIQYTSLDKSVRDTVESLLELGA